MTGSPNQAARLLGRHMVGAQQLRTARGGKSFSEAWDAALDIARDREVARIHGNLADLAASQAEENDIAAGAQPQPIRIRREGDEDWYSDESRLELLNSRRTVRLRLTRARRMLLASICDNPSKRAAWELLVGPADWARANRMLPQPDEPFDDDALDLPCTDPFPVKGGEEMRAFPSLANPDMLLTAEAGLLAEFTGGHDAMAEIIDGVAKMLEEESESAEGKPASETEQACLRDAEPVRPGCESGASDSFDVTGFTPVTYLPVEPVRTFTLKDETCLSGVRAHPDNCERGGGYLTLPMAPSASRGYPLSAPYAPGELAGMVVRPGVAGAKPGHTIQRLDYHVTEDERRAVAEWVWRVERGG